MALLAKVEPAHRANIGEMATLQIGGGRYQALDAAKDALARSAAERGHPGRYSAPTH